MIAQQFSRWLSWLTALSALSLLLAAPCRSRADDEGQKEGQVRDKAAAKVDAAAKHYWIGVHGFPVDDLLKTHLRIESGVVLSQVQADSPADKAGLKRHDVLLKFGEKTVGDLGDLADAVAANKDQEAAAEVIREGKKQTLTITPAVRDGRQRLVPREDDAEGFAQWLERLRRGQVERDPMRMFFFRPGRAVPEGEGGFHFQGDLPKGMSVTITKKDNEPARITVKKGDQIWEVTEDDLRKLPDEVRPHVERWLQHGGTRAWLQPRPIPPARDVAPPASDRAVDELKKELDKLRRDVEKLHDKRGKGNKGDT